MGSGSSVALQKIFALRNLQVPAPKIFIFDTSLIEMQAASDTGNPTDLTLTTDTDTDN